MSMPRKQLGRPAHAAALLACLAMVSMLLGAAACATTDVSDTVGRAPLSKGDICAMSTAEARQELTRISRLRQDATVREDARLRAQLNREFSMILQYLRSGDES